MDFQVLHGGLFANKQQTKTFDNKGQARVLHGLRVKGVAFYKTNMSLLVFQVVGILQGQEGREGEREGRCISE